MAPPGNRRSGFSRRAQYSTFAGYLIAVAGVIVAALILFVSIRNEGLFSGPRSVTADATAPIAGTSAIAREDGRGLWATLSGYFVSGSENARLKREIAIARVRLAEGAAVADENRRLKALLGLTESDPKPVAATRLIGSTATSTRRFATLGAGAADGVTVGMPVRSPLGLVGRVLETGRSTARVLLITDPESVVPVRRAADGIAGFAQGRGDGTIQIRLVELGINPLRRGDPFVTSGTGGLYRPGIAIAVVTKLLPDGAIARPLSDPATTDLVVVDPEWRPLGPTVPEPSGSPSATPAAP